MPYADVLFELFECFPSDPVQCAACAAVYGSNGRQSSNNHLDNLELNPSSRPRKRPWGQPAFSGQNRLGFWGFFDSPSARRSFALTTSTESALPPQQGIIMTRDTLARAFKKIAKRTVLEGLGPPLGYSFGYKSATLANVA